MKHRSKSDVTTETPTAAIEAQLHLAETSSRQQQKKNARTLSQRVQFWKKPDTLSFAEKRQQTLESLKQELMVEDHSMPQKDLLDKLQVDATEGLSDAEAANRLANGKPNELTPPKKTPEILKLLYEMIAGFGPMLLGAAFLSIVAYIIQCSMGPSPPDNVIKFIW